MQVKMFSKLGKKFPVLEMVGNQNYNGNDSGKRLSDLTLLVMSMVFQKQN